MSPAPTPALSLRGVRKAFGATEVIRGVDLTLITGERHAIIGPNGAGKSTLFHLISGKLRPDAGEILLGELPIQGVAAHRINRLGLARSFQTTSVFPKLSVRENLRLGVLQRHGLDYAFWRLISREKAVNEETDQLMQQVRLSARRDDLAGTLSYAEQRSLEIGVALATNPRVLLLDEPMAGMSTEESRYTTGLLRQVTAGRSLLIVEHDMDVVFALNDRISVLAHGQVVATGTPEEVRRNPVVQQVYLGQEREP